MAQASVASRSSRARCASAAGRRSRRLAQARRARCGSVTETSRSGLGLPQSRFWVVGSSPKLIAVSRAPRTKSSITEFMRDTGTGTGPSMRADAMGHFSSSLPRPRELAGSELAYVWRGTSASVQLPWQASLPVNVTVGPQKARLFHANRWQTPRCAPRAFELHLQADCLLNPSADEWLTLLDGRDMVFVGDSMLRDFFFLTVATMLQAASQRNLSVRVHGNFDALHPGTPGHRHPISSTLLVELGGLAMNVAPTTRLHWCWYTDVMRCLSELRVDSAPVHVLQHGAHEPPSAFKTPKQLSHPYLPLAGHVDRAVANGDTVIWTEYATPHFAWGAGEFEDASSSSSERSQNNLVSGGGSGGSLAVNKVANRSSLASYGLSPGVRCRASADQRETNDTPSGSTCFGGLLPRCLGAQWQRQCLPLGRCESAIARARRTVLRDAYAARGALVLPMSDLSAAAYDSHVMVAAGAPPVPPSRTSPNGMSATDCRHYCNPSSLTVAWSRRLFTMLAGRRVDKPQCRRGANEPLQVQALSSAGSAPGRSIASSNCVLEVNALPVCAGDRAPT